MGMADSSPLFRANGKAIQVNWPAGPLAGGGSIRWKLALAVDRKTRAAHLSSKRRLGPDGKPGRWIGRRSCLILVEANSETGSTIAALATSPSPAS